MNRVAQKPVRSEAGPHDDYREDHPAYGQIGVSRVTSTPGAVLYGSDFRHGGYMVITVRRSSVARSLSSDYHHGGDDLVQVALSEAQWATFLSTPNIGMGVPCTIQYTDVEGYVPSIVPDSNRRAQFNDEIGATLQDAIGLMTEVMDSAPTKALREKARRAIQELKANLPFVAKRYDEHAEETGEKLKVEVAAYIAGAVTRAGLTALGAPSHPLIELAEGD